MLLPRSEFEQQRRYQEALSDIAVVFQPAQYAFPPFGALYRQIVGHQFAIRAGKHNLVVFELVKANFGIDGMAFILLLEMIAHHHIVRTDHVIKLQPGFPVFSRTGIKSEDIERIGGKRQVTGNCISNGIMLLLIPCPDRHGE